MTNSGSVWKSNFQALLCKRIATNHLPAHDIPYALKTTVNGKRM